MTAEELLPSEKDSRDSTWRNDRESRIWLESEVNKEEDYSL
jgi:hypothetical protein